jgi:anti-sigma factor RsiW
MSGDPGDATSPEQGAELLTAYVDGVAELTPDERHRVAALLAVDPQAQADQAAVRTLIDRLRELPTEGAEPDWMAMERSIRQAVGPQVPRPWWRRWTWLAPATMLATAAAVLLVIWARPASTVAPDVPSGVDRGSHDPPPAEDAEVIVALWLDGAEVDVDLSASDVLAEVAPGDDDPAQPGAELDAEPELGLLPSTDLAWIDKLDDAAIDRAERWLARKKG